MKHTLLLVLIALVALSACKSNNDDQNPVPTNLVSGYLTVSRQLDLDSPATKYTEQAWAAFFMHPYQYASDSMHVTVDSIRLNGANMVLDNASRMYRYSGKIKADSACVWQVWSGTNLASFAYNFVTPGPTYIFTLPDQVDRSMALSIPLPAGADSSTMTLSGSRVLMQSFTGSSGGFSAAELSTLDAGNATLEVVGYKRTTQAFGGKNFLFTKRTVKTKAVTLQ